MAHKSGVLDVLRRLAGFVLCCLLPMSSWAQLSLQEGSNTVVTVQLAGLHQFRYSAFYAAIAQGYYERAGLSVILKEGGPGVNPINEVSNGWSDYGVAEADILSAYLNGAPLLALAVLNQHAQQSVFSLDKAAIQTPHDLLGKQVRYDSRASGLLLEALLVSEGVVSSQVDYRLSETMIQDLLQGNADAIVADRSALPGMLQDLNIEYQEISLQDYGLDFYGNTLFTHARRAKGMPEQVQRFREATLKGWRYALEHPQDMVALILTDYRVNAERDDLEYEVSELQKAVVPDMTTLGYMNPGRWEVLAELVADVLRIPESERPSIEGFLYDPEQNDRIIWLQKLLAGVVIASVVCLVLLILWFVYKEALKRAVQAQTEKFQDDIAEMGKHLNQLREQYREQKLRNGLLEYRISERDKTMVALHQELSNEATERERKEWYLKLYDTAIGVSSSGILVADWQGRVVYANPTFCAQTRYSLDQLLDKPVSVLNSTLPIPGFDVGKTRPNIDKSAKVDVCCLNDDQEEVWLQVQVVPVRNLKKADSGQRSESAEIDADPDSADEGGAESDVNSNFPAPDSFPEQASDIRNYVIVCENVTERRVKRFERDKQAITDVATGLDSRGLFMLKLEKLLASGARTGGRHALLLIDIERLRDINYRYGYSIGDQLIRAMAGRIQEHFPKSESNARFAGDEFAVLLGGIHNIQDARSAATGLLDVLNAPLVGFPEGMQASASVGIRLLEYGVSQRDELLNQADKALQMAKTGNAAIQVYTGSRSTKGDGQQALLNELSTALAEDQLELRFQPRVDLTTMSMTLVEGLVRWTHPNKGMLFPEDFLPHVSHSPLALEVDRWVLNQSVDAIRFLQREGFGRLLVAINVACLPDYGDAFLAQVEQIFSRNPELGGKLALEIPEHQLRENFNRITPVLHKLSKCGVLIVIDNFGNGQSLAMSELKALPIRSLNITRELLQPRLSRTENEQLVSAMQSVAQRMGLQLSAVGVEDDQQVSFLQQLGCESAQGYFFGQAMTLTKLVQKLHDAQSFASSTSLKKA
ncbi:MAG: EAL domain-containing protein [Pseudomonadales bacterium]|nr:EAL domain-containing protein [Pseudomonadales bacterium]